MSSVVKSASDAVNSAVTSVAGAVDPYVPQVAKNAASFAAGTASATVAYAGQTATAVKDRAVSTVNGTAHDALELGKVAVNGATTTVTALTPGPVLRLVTSTVEGATSLATDPVAAIKPYVPTFVIHAGEKTYEIVHSTHEKTVAGINSTTGFIVTKVRIPTQLDRTPASVNPPPPPPPGNK
ncbi:hypothetical protein BDK51DRAFT_22955 [Blyttiomyces helicus]|uniref:Uncharacterized protein n=1 Tax=Blyttiomyces helicus TaxID=388810 RepID=A0A4P9W3B4_9FUNG|nr:hypothetical protein BDK51DRAFT_22955 [Blyttiomyces helicus]|eukprot:RKO86799.1 hypothetical protein BDK51DRAFT_22955 [Blyttiomyces helicus]